MSPDRWRYRLSPEERQVLAKAKEYFKSLNKAARPYAADLLKPRIVPSDSSRKFLTREIDGSRWRFVITRHSLAFIDIEIGKFPLLAGEDTLEESIRIRPAVDPLVRFFALSQSKGPERFENDQNAYERTDSFIKELEAIL